MTSHSTTLLAIVERLALYDENATIYSCKPWTPESPALVECETEAGGPPVEARSIGAEYFIEVDIAREFLEGWLQSTMQTPELRAQCERLIRYATHDA